MSQRTIESINPALRDFDLLPSSAYIDIKVLKALRSCSAATIWRGVNTGRIPKPYKLSSRCTRWSVGELRQSLATAK